MPEDHLKLGECQGFSKRSKLRKITNLGRALLCHKNKPGFKSCKECPAFKPIGRYESMKNTSRKRGWH